MNIGNFSVHYDVYKLEYFFKKKPFIKNAVMKVIVIQ